jgi:hypothetical protein
LGTETAFASAEGKGESEGEELILRAGEEIGYGR